MTRPRALVLLALVDAGVLAGLALAVVAVPAVSRLDAAVSAAFGPWRTAPLVEVFLWITALGTGPTLVAVMATGTALAWATAGPRPVVPLWVAYLGTEATVWAAKYAIGRHRPQFIEAISAVSPSFPSAHAAGSAVVYGAIACLVVRRLPPRGRARAAVATATATVVLLIGFSRIFLSLHFVTDVAAGYAIALLWLCLARRMLPAASLHGRA